MADTAQPIGGLPDAGALADTDKLEIERGDGAEAVGLRTTVADIAAAVAASGSAQTGDVLLTVRNPGGDWLEQGAVYPQVAYPELFALVGLLPDGPPGASFSGIPGGTGRAASGYVNITDDHIVGFGGTTIWRSFDRGVTWASGTLPASVSAGVFLPSGLYLSGQNVLLRSVDRGATFSAISLPAGFGTTPPRVTQSAGRIFVFGPSGTWRSDTFGASWSPLSRVSASNILSIGNGVVIAFDHGVNSAGRSENNGDTFTGITMPENGPSNSNYGVSFGNGVGVIVGNNSVLRTTDHGKTWVSGGLTNIAPSGRMFYRQGRLFGASTSALYYSDSMGASWSSQVSVSNSGIWYFDSTGLVMPAANGASAQRSPYQYNYDPAIMFKTPTVSDVRGYIKP